MTTQPADGRELPDGPFAVMSGAPWNVLDSRGVRIACCGGDSNADWERFGPSIAAAIVAALNGHPAQPESAELESILPSTWYADRPFATRLQFMVDHWRRLCVAIERAAKEAEAAESELTTLRAKLAAELERVRELEAALRGLRGDGGFPLWPSISVTAAHLREIASELGHTEAVQNCRHCTYAYAAKSLERFMEGIDAALPAPPAKEVEGGR